MAKGKTGKFVKGGEGRQHEAAGKKTKKATRGRTPSNSRRLLEESSSWKDTLKAYRREKGKPLSGGVLRKHHRSVKRQGRKEARSVESGAVNREKKQEKKNTRQWEIVKKSSHFAYRRSPRGKTGGRRVSLHTNSIAGEGEGGASERGKGFCGGKKTEVKNLSSPIHS